MTRAVAITHQDSLKAAIDSAVNSAKLVTDFMYGTPERTRMTALFSVGLFALATFMSSAHIALLSYCS